MPNGSHIYNGLVYMHRSAAHRSKNRSRDSFFGFMRRLAGPTDLISCDHSYLCNTYFSGSLNSRDSMIRHTYLGYHNLGMSKLDADRLLAAMDSGTSYLPRFLHLRNEGKFFLRWCPKCAEEDIQVRGVGFWNVLHQIPSLDICYKHGDPLLWRCRSCKSMPGYLIGFRLPGEACKTCGALDFESDDFDTSPGHIKFSKAAAHAFFSQSDVYREEVWEANLIDFIRKIGSINTAEQYVGSVICQDWGVSSYQELLELIRIKNASGRGFLTKGGKTLCEKIVIGVAMKEINPRKITGISLSDKRIYNEDFADVVKRIGQDLMMDATLLTGLATDMSISEVAKKMGLRRGFVASKWSILLMSLLKLLGEETVRKILPKSRRLNNRTLICRVTDPKIRYRNKVIETLKSNPKITRSELWMRCSSEMRYLRRNDHEWVVENVLCLFGVKERVGQK